jgi:GDPmannose 4,6-dehydratase
MEMFTTRGSMKTNSVISYILLSLEAAGYPINKIETSRGDKVVKEQIETDSSEIFGMRFKKTRIDDMMLRGELEFSIEDCGITAYSGSKKIKIVFDRERFRPAEVPITLSDTRKIKSLGFKVEHELEDIIKNQLYNYI